MIRIIKYITRTMTKRTGFTFVELLVVIAIILILGSIALIKYQDIRTKAKITRASAELDEIASIIEMARYKTGLTTGCLTASNPCFPNTWTDHSCVDPAGQDLRHLPNLHDCHQLWRGSLLLILDKAGVVARGTMDHDQYVAALIPEVDKFDHDPWGSPYLLKENDGSRSQTEPPYGCKSDKLFSAGPDGIPETADDIHSREIPRLFYSNDESVCSVGIVRCPGAQGC